jgi:hypothetical protein
MHVFTVLYTACTDSLPEAESLLLYREVTEMDENPRCTVDTSLIISRAEAKQRKIVPTCEVDAFPSLCDSFIAAKLKSCKADYCESCAEAHSCDHSCDLPCAGGVANGAHRQICFLFYAPLVLSRHMTGWPKPAVRAGGHRLLAELANWADPLDELSATCPLGELKMRVAALNVACCAELEEGDGHGACVDGVPTSCAYNCGRVWTAFREECWSLMTSFDFFDHEGQNFDRLTDRCLDIDPVGMALALYDATCGICGDSLVSVELGEECDAGGDNSNAPDATCRPNCKLPHCGDQVVDLGRGETCDNGPSNCGVPGNMEGCSPDTACTAICQPPTAPCTYLFDFDNGDVNGWTSNTDNLATSPCGNDGLLGGYNISLGVGPTWSGSSI